MTENRSSDGRGGLELPLLADGRFGRGPERDTVGLEGDGLELRELGRAAARVLRPPNAPGRRWYVEGSKIEINESPNSQFIIVVH